MLFFGALFGKDKHLQRARGLLRDSFGGIALQSPAIPWDHSTHYSDELGLPITRVFLFFKTLIEEDTLSGVKLAAMDIEQGLCGPEGKRTVNLDPGYLTPAKVVLATTKDYCHRINIGRGVYADLTLIFREGQYHPHLNTYIDYADGRYDEVFLQAREMLKAKILRMETGA